MIFNRKKILQLIDQYDPQVKYRAYDRITEELKLMSKGAYESFIRKVGKSGMAAIKFMDRQTVLTGWYATFLKGLQQGMNEAEAAKYAQQITLKTQPQAAAKDLPTAYRTSEMLNFFLMFSNQLNQIFNLMTYNVPRAVRDKRIGEAMGTLAGIAISGIAIGALTRRRFPDEPEELAKDILFQMISAFPLGGSQIVSALEGYRGGGVDIVPVFTELGRTGRMATEVLTDGGGVDVQTLLELIASGMVMLGFPTVQPRRVLKALAQGDPFELIGGDWGE
jgi:hypothetical protein